MPFDADDTDCRIAELEAAWSTSGHRPRPRAAGRSRGDAFRVSAVAALLVLSVGLLAVGICTMSPAAWLGGNAVFLLAFAADGLLAKKPGGEPVHPSGQRKHRHHRDRRTRDRHLRLDPAPEAAWGLGNRIAERRAARSFAAAIAEGDLDTAEASLRGVVDAQTCGQRTRGWDERFVVDGTWLEVARDLRASDGLRPWCRTMRSSFDADGPWVSLGFLHTVRLRVVARQWFAEGIRFCAERSGSVLTGRLTIRPSPDPQKVEVWVHAEGPDMRCSRRALRAMRRETLGAGKRWVAQRR
ncbi:MAG: hypothetical protein KDB35_01805 [Acidimicrobiales bacterium]|nr:hypothetical protein [Acidimicrobiales bacterium]